MSSLIIVTRPRGQVAEVLAQIESMGFLAKNIPTIELIARQSFSQEFFALLQKSNDINGLFFSSSNGVRFCVEALNNYPSCPTPLRPWHLPVYCIGRRTAEVAQDMGFKANFYPNEASLQGFLKEFASPNKSIPLTWIHPCSTDTELKAASFLEKGIHITNIPAYAPFFPIDSKNDLQQFLPQAHALLFYSGSAVQQFFKNNPVTLPLSVKLLTLGLSASKACKELGFEPHLIQSLEEIKLYV